MAKRSVKSGVTLLEEIHEFVQVEQEWQAKGGYSSSVANVVIKQALSYLKALLEQSNKV